MRMKLEHPASGFARADAQIEDVTSIDPSRCLGDHVLKHIEGGNGRTDSSAVTDWIVGDLPRSIPQQPSDDGA
jgi:hypothetical protein